MKVIADPQFIRMVRATLVAMIPSWIVACLFFYLVYTVAQEIGREAGIF